MSTLFLRNTVLTLSPSIGVLFVIVSTKLSAVAVSAALLVGGTALTSALYKEVTLTVDGDSTAVGGLAFTVEDVLRNKGIALAERDLVYPAVTDPVSDGQHIVVQLSKKLELTVDGVPRTIYTTATTVDDALTAVPAPPAGGLEAVSLPVDDAAPRGAGRDRDHA